MSLNVIVCSYQRCRKNIAGPEGYGQDGACLHCVFSILLRAECQL